MRIISLLVMLPMLWTTIIPQYVSAAETVNTDETKIKFEIQSDLRIIDGVINGDSSIAIDIPYYFPGYEPIVAQDELRRDRVLSRFAKKIAATIFPEGKFAINASAYTAAADECGKSDGITASGLLVKEKRTIACPPQFPLGTKIKIEGHGDFVCEDRGGAIKGNHFDIYMQTKKQAFAFGRRNLMAEVMN